jgi:type IV pilus assembly protein PilP
MTASRTAGTPAGHACAASTRRRLCALLAACALAGCEADRDELREWMAEARRTTPAVTEKIAQPKRFEPFRYGPGDAVDPFSLAKLNVGLPAEPERRPGHRGPDGTRRREPLEAYPLDNLKLVGHLRQGTRRVALLKADALVHPVSVGNYVGQNHGRITKVSEAEITIRELVQDAAGDWVERDTALHLQETRQ